MNTCNTCRFRVKGDCHRFPPAVNTHRDISVWPSVRPDDWCGEWKAEGPLVPGKSFETQRVLDEVVLAMERAAADGALGGAELARRPMDEAYRRRTRPAGWKEGD